MSGGKFDYDQYRIDSIADSIQLEIDRNGKEIPVKDRWYDKDWYDKYPEDKYYPKYSDEVLMEFKNAINILRRASLYTQRIDWYLSGDDGEESFLRRLKHDLEQIEKNKFGIVNNNS